MSGSGPQHGCPGSGLEALSLGAAQGSLLSGKSCQLQLWKLRHVFSHSVLSDSATPWAVAAWLLLSVGILQARVLDWVAVPSSRGSSQPRDRTQVSRTAGRFFPVQDTREG